MWFGLHAIGSNVIWSALKKLVHIFYDGQVFVGKMRSRSKM